MSVRKRQEKNGCNVRGDGGDGNKMLPLHNEQLNVDKLSGDRKNIVLLFFLYTLQGIPLGLSAAIPMILQNRGVNYKQQAGFSFVNWPFSLKLIWAPIVDSLYISAFGRRKTWLIPTQYLIGVTMFVLSLTVDMWLGDNDQITPNIIALTVAFCWLNFLAATQDIAVDGWALTMLKKCNVGHASTCNSTGQTAGYFLGYVLFLALESPEFCNNYLRSLPEPQGIITLSGFLYFWSLIFLTSTTLLAVLKTETKSTHIDSVEQIDMNVKEAYSTLFKIAQMKPIIALLCILMTAKIGFSATDAVSSLKLVEGGLPKEKLGFLAVPLIPLQIILVFVISKWTSGPRPMDIYINAIPYRLLFGLFAMFIVWITPMAIQDGIIPYYYYFVLLLLYGVHQVLMNCMFVSIMAFFAKISDPSVGGTYMTLLNTISNLGGIWPSTLALWFVDTLTWRGCESGGTKMVENVCSTLLERKECAEFGGTCVTYIDGFYLEAIICIFIGFIWYFCVAPKIEDLQTLDESHWKVRKHKSYAR